MNLVSRICRGAASLGTAPFLVFLLAQAIPRTALASESQDAETQARVFNLKGNAAFKRGDDAAARDNYKKSLELHESFDTFCKLGRVEESLGQLSESYFNLGMCLRLYPADDDLASAKVKYAGLRDEVRAQLSPEAMAAIDRRVKEHQVGPKAAVAVVPESERPEASDPAQADQEAEEQPAVDPGLDETPRQGSSARLPVSLGVGIVGLGAVGAGVGLLIDSKGKRNEASEQRERMEDENIDCVGVGGDAPTCKRLDKLADQADQRRTMGIIIAASGGAVVVGATLLYVLWPKPATDTAQAELHPLERDGYRKVGAFGLRPEIFAGTHPQDWSLGLSGRF